MSAIKCSRIEGRVKWFNAEKGFGFIVSRDLEKDVFVYYENIIQEIGKPKLKYIRKAEAVMFQNVVSSRGNKAIEVTRPSGKALTYITCYRCKGKDHLSVKCPSFKINKTYPKIELENRNREIREINKLVEKDTRIDNLTVGITKLEENIKLLEEKNAELEAINSDVKIKLKQKEEEISQLIEHHVVLDRDISELTVENKRLTKLLTPKTIQRKETSIQTEVNVQDESSQIEFSSQDKGCQTNIILEDRGTLSDKEHEKYEEQVEINKKLKAELDDITSQAIRNRERYEICGRQDADDIARLENTVEELSRKLENVDEIPKTTKIEENQVNLINRKDKQKHSVGRKKGRIEKRDNIVEIQSDSEDEQILKIETINNSQMKSKHRNTASISAQDLTERCSFLMSLSRKREPSDVEKVDNGKKDRNKPKARDRIYRTEGKDGLNPETGVITWGTGTTPIDLGDGKFFYPLGHPERQKIIQAARQRREIQSRGNQNFADNQGRSRDYYGNSSRRY